MVRGYVRPTPIPIRLQVIRNFVWMYVEPPLIVAQAKLVIFRAAPSMFIIVRQLWDPTYWKQGRLVLSILNVLLQLVLREHAEKFACEMLIVLAIRCAEQRY